MANKKRQTSITRKQRPLFSYPADYYYPSSITIAHVLTEKQVRKEYSRLRKIAESRFKRLKEAGFAEADIYKNYRDEIKKLSEFKTDRELYNAFGRVAGFLSAKTSTVTGQKQAMDEAISSLHEHGYNFVNRENFNLFRDFMEKYRTEKMNKLYDSGQAARLAELVEKKKIPPEEIFNNFEFYVKNQEAISKMRRPKNKQDISADYYREKLNARQSKKGRNRKK